MTKKSLSWRYYQAYIGPGLWNGPDAILRIRESPTFRSNVLAPPSTVLTDIANGKLADVVWVTPTSHASDHAYANDGSGPSWVAAVVNAIGQSQYWNDTAIFVTWDDWGGWFDHVPPPVYNSYELGFRVPLVVVSPYAKAHYVSHVQHEFASISQSAGGDVRVELDAHDGCARRRSCGLLRFFAAPEKIQTNSRTLLGTAFLEAADFDAKSGR